MNDSTRKGRRLSEAERKLWRLFSRDIKSIESPQKHATDTVPDASPGNKLPNLGKSNSKALLFSDRIQPEIRLPPLSSPGRDTRQGTDRRTYKKLRRGKMQIEATLDLHGRTQKQAYDDLLWFLKAAHDTNKRTVVVITGKGNRYPADDQKNWAAPEPGILRRKLPEWLTLPPLNKIVLEYTPARQRDGGEGAFYILLRRKKD